MIDPHAIKVHGITDEFVANQAKFKDIMIDFIDFVHGAELIMHNASFDQSFIDNELSLAGFDYKLEEICKITDTLKIARELHPGENNSLDGLCSRYSVNELDRSFHGALLDARLLAYVYLKLTIGQNNFSDLSVEQSIQDNDGDTLPKNFKVIKASSDDVILHESYFK